MPQIIANTYEILQQIGSGGAGVVYLGRHTRLDKPVVLKADKRELSTSTDLLRREVDALKNLSHTYIPQVYDYVQEGDTVYTVMDYIEGESLDKPLKRGERFPQSRVITWACQLLEALVYLHSRPPHGILHCDIKPANIMLTPQGDIRLIDFNIAYALGEEGTILVAYSKGYASPEHYTRTIYPVSGETEGTEQLVGPTNSSSRTRQRQILLDTRSDIYSLGATLYHLLTGTRPPSRAADVPPITDPAVSPAVAAIVQKAMNPDRDKRYQTAQEMLDAFHNLRQNDPRTRRLKRRTSAAMIAASLLLVAGGVCTFLGQRQMRREEQTARVAAEAAETQERIAKEAEQRANQALELVTASREAMDAGNAEGAAAQAVKALRLDTTYNSQAQYALTDALGVYDLSDGFHAKTSITLPSEPLKLMLSPQGTRLAVLYAWKLAVYDASTGAKLAALPIEESALSDAVFLNENRIIYAGPGALQAYDLSTGAELWSGEAATHLALSADGSTLAAVYKDAGEALIYDAESGALKQTVSFLGHHQRVASNDRFADPRDNLLALNADGTLLGASFSDGYVRVFDLRNSDGDLELLDPSDYVHFEGGFSGKYFALSAYTSVDGGDSLLAIIDKEQPRVAASSSLQTPFHIQADENGIFISNENVLTEFDMAEARQIELAYTEKDIVAFHHTETHTILTTEDHRFCFFNRSAEQVVFDPVPAEYHCDFVDLAGGIAVVGGMDTPSLRILTLEDHADAEILAYDPSYLHSEARLAADGRTVTLFRYDRFRVYTLDGEIVSDVELPDADEVYDQQFRRQDGDSWLEVIWNDGLTRRYSARDGILIGEEQGEQPDLTLYEEFFTERYRITSPLHGKPAAYARSTGELVRELQPDAYLTYVTELGENIIIEYVTAQGERYGLLLNGELETLAKMPRLCDVTEDYLMFDDSSGSLRRSRIYDTGELMALAEQQ